MTDPPTATAQTVLGFSDSIGRLLRGELSVRTLMFVLILFCPRAAMTQQVAIPPGTLTLPPGFTQQSLRGTDSYPGLISADDGSLVIHYDIGPMAGAHVHPSRRADFVWFIAHEVDGLAAYTGLYVKEGRQQLATTVLGTGRTLELPANFEATVSGAHDVAAFMVIVTSYRPRTKP